MSGSSAENRRIKASTFCNELSNTLPVPFCSSFSSFPFCQKFRAYHVILSVSYLCSTITRRRQNYCAIRIIVLLHCQSYAEINRDLLSLYYLIRRDVIVNVVVIPVSQNRNIPRDWNFYQYPCSIIKIPEVIFDSVNHPASERFDRGWAIYNI